MSKKLISAVIPVYGCSYYLNELYTELVKHLSSISETFEIILVNDASPDKSWEIIAEISTKDSRVKGLNLSRNFGQHYAIKAGLDAAQGEWIVVMDCDLQDKPSEIPKLYRKAMEGYDVVFARRFERQDNYIKKICSALFYRILSYATNTEQDESIANFGIYRYQVIRATRELRETMQYFPAMIRWVGFCSTAIDVEHGARDDGKSAYSFIKRMRLALDVLTAFSDKILYLIIKLGLFISGSSFCYALFIFLKASFTSRKVEGWASLIVSIWFLSGLMILILGVIGIYLAKTFSESKKRPLYIVKDSFNTESHE